MAKRKKKTKKTTKSKSAKKKPKKSKAKLVDFQAIPAGIVLSKSDCEILNIQSGSHPDQVSFNGGLGIRYTDSELLVSVSGETDVRYLGIDDIAIKLHLSLLVTYQINRSPNEKELQKLVQEDALPSVWPYMRETTTTTAARMGLHGVQLPLYSAFNVTKE